MISSLPLKKNSLMFAPMEGITDECYRKTIFQLYPEWDTMSCDFLRVPNPSPYPKKHIIKHFGKDIYQNPQQKEKMIYQILTSPGAYTARTVQDISALGFNWIDLNLGCPSKTVCKNKGGSYLLSDLENLKVILKLIRENFPGTFTCKIRVGYEDDSLFENVLKLIEDSGVDAIKIHARTRAQLYKGFANWDYVKKAVSITKIPIIGNGDIWTKKDIETYYDYTNCHSIMLGRPALKTPWLAKLYKSGIEDSLEIRAKEIKNYFQSFYDQTANYHDVEAARIKRIKSITRYLFEDFPDGDLIKRKVLLAKDFETQMSAVDELSSLF